MSGNVLLPGNILSLTGAAADRLLKSGSGDAALLYLYLLRSGGTFSPGGARHTLGWADERVRTAFDALVSLGLADGQTETAPAPQKPEPDEPPAYTAADIARELEGGGTFPHVVAEVQRQLGKMLSTADLQILYSLYDYLALPAEVIFLLTTWCVEESERKYGPGRKPRLSQIRKEGFIWRRLGVDTAEAADAHMRALSALHTRERAILPLLGISGRAPVEGERRYISAWVDMGFDDEAIRLAYEKTVLKKQSLNWAYMNSILKSWHQKNLHTLEQVEAGDSAYRRQNRPVPADPKHAQARMRDDMDWMDRFLAQTDDTKGGT